MKLTKSKLREMVKQELKEISGTAGGTTAIKQEKAAEKASADAVTTRDTKKSVFDMYRYFKAYKLIARVGPLSSN